VTSRPPSSQSGFALVAVLLVLAIVGVVGAEFSYAMRLEASAVRAYRDGILAAHLAEAGIEQAIRELLAVNAAYVALDDDGALTFYTRERTGLPRRPRAKVPFGPGQYSYRISDEEARINVNAAPPERFDRLLHALGLEKNVRDAIVDSVQDWRDANEEHRANGAESEDYYLKLPLPYRSRNGNLESLVELRQIKGITDALYEGTPERLGLAEVLTVRSTGQININTTGPLVLRALGFSEAEISDVTLARRDAIFLSVPGRFAGRGLVATTRTFRIEAEGVIDGQVRARITAIVQRRTDTAPSSVAILEWSGIR
jgi:general secretion pathway protein K